MRQYQKNFKIFVCAIVYGCLSSKYNLMGDLCLFTISAIQKYKALKVGLKLTKALLGGMGEEFTDSTIENKILEKNTRFIIYHKKVRCF